jgi:hypothetical protein
MDRETATRNQTRPTSNLFSTGIDAPTSQSFQSVDARMRASRDRLANHGSEAPHSQVALEWRYEFACCMGTGNNSSLHNIL